MNGKRVIQKAVSFILVLMLIMASFPAANVYAAEKTYKVTDTITAVLKDGVLTISGTGAMPDYSRVSSWNTGEDLSEYEPWHNEAYSIRTIVVEPGITRIGNYSFSETAVESVTIADSVVEIGTSAFSNCYSLTSITLPKNLRDISESLFANDWNLESLTYGDKISYIGSSAFWGTKIKELHFPASLTEIHEDAFGYTAFEKITVDAKNPSFSSKDGVLYSKNGKTLIYVPRAFKTSLFKCAGVEEIGQRAFEGVSGVTAVDLTGVKIIGANAFANSGLTSLHIADSVEKVDTNAFYGCSSLRKLTIGKGLESLALNCFYNCSIEELVLPETLKYVTAYSFSTNQSLKKVVVKGATILGEGCFGRCTSLTSVTLNEGLKYICGDAFIYCDNLKTVALPESVIYIQDCAFDEATDVTNDDSFAAVSDNGAMMKVDAFGVRGTRKYDNAFEVLKLVNEERAAVGAAPLRMESSLLESAMIRAAELTVLFSHDRPIGLDCFSINSKMSGENIALGQGSPSHVMNSWMNSDGHRGNILSSGFSTIGIGCFEYNGRIHWVQVFGGGELSSDCAKPQDVDVSETVLLPAEKIDGYNSFGDDFPVWNWPSESFEFEYSLTPSPITISENDKEISTTLRVKQVGSYGEGTVLDPKSVRWSSSKESVAKVKDGNITAIAKGKSEVSASSANRVVAKVSVSVCGWEKDAGKWKYVDESGSYSVNKWTKVDNAWYYFDKDGYMKTGWQKITGKWYFFNQSGVMQTGWLCDAGKWYYFGSDGAMVRGWQKVNDVWYYFGWPNDPDSGAMRTGWVYDGGTWYYMHSSGRMMTGWIQSGGTWYYLKGSGAMAANEYVSGYWLNANGSWTYPHRASWRKSGNRWWYGDTSGWYAASATYRIDGVNYSFDAAGWMK